MAMQVRLYTAAASRADLVGASAVSIRPATAAAGNAPACSSPRSLGIAAFGPPGLAVSSPTPRPPPPAPPAIPAVVTIERTLPAEPRVSRNLRYRRLPYRKLRHRRNVTSATGRKLICVPAPRPAP